MKEIKEILASHPDRKEAEKIVREKYIPLLKETIKKVKEADKEWFNQLKKDQEPLADLIEAMGDLYKDSDEE